MAWRDMASRRKSTLDYHHGSIAMYRKLILSHHACVWICSTIVSVLKSSLFFDGLSLGRATCYLEAIIRPAVSSSG